MNKYLFPVLSCLLLLNACNNSSGINKQSGETKNLQYELVNNWPQFPAAFILGDVTGIGIDTAQNIFIFHRAERDWTALSSIPDTPIAAKTILELDRTTGKIINSWGAGLFLMPHGLTVDKDNNVWVTDVGSHQVFKFSHEGVLLMKLGIAKVPGDDDLHFDMPTDVAVTNDGSFYVSDGYSNSRIIKFSASGKYLFQWGKKGSGPGEFDIPHAVDLDEKGNVYVADRENNRVQVFNANGKFLKAFADESFGEIYSVAVDTMHNKVLATDYISTIISTKGSDIIVFDTTGNIENRFGKSGSYDGPVCRYHNIAVDKEGNIYVGDILDNHIQKFKRVE